MESEEQFDVLDAYLDDTQASTPTNYDQFINEKHEYKPINSITSSPITSSPVFLSPVYHSAEDVSKANKFGFLKQMTKRGNKFVERTKEWSGKKKGFIFN